MHDNGGRSESLTVSCHKFTNLPRSSKMETSPHRPTLEGVPKQFVASLRVLFDILDEQKTGFVRLADIETRWKEEGVSGLPKGVVEALKKVTPQSGKLSFERFVAGLKIALLRSKGDTGIRVTPEPNPASFGPRPDLLSHSPHDDDDQSIPTGGPASSHLHTHGGSNHARANPNALRASQADPQGTQRFMQEQNQRNYGPTTAAVRPNNAMALAQRTKSMPHLGLGGRVSPQFGTEYDVLPGMKHQGQADGMAQSARNPVVLRHESASTGRLGWSQGPDLQGRNKDDIVNALKKWQHDRMNPDDNSDNSKHFIEAPRFPGNRPHGPADGRPLSIASTSAFEHYGRDPLPQSQEDPLSAAANRKTTRRREPRRHTLANGIDFNMIKRMKQLEQEKDVLLQGLECVERARDWYHTQIRAVQDKQKYIGKSSSHNDNSVEAHQERMNFQQARIFEVNQQLKALVESSEKGFPLHMNLAVSQPPPPGQRSENSETSNIVAMLKAQNRMLTQEVSQKSDKISQLEREKATLIRDMFEARSKNRSNSYEDTTFM